jgi:hypothetical protein
MRQQGWLRSREARADVCRGRDLLKEKRLGRQAAVPAQIAPSVNALQFDCLLPLPQPFECHGLFCKRCEGFTYLLRIPGFVGTTMDAPEIIGHQLIGYPVAQQESLNE